MLEPGWVWLGLNPGWLGAGGITQHCLQQDTLPPFLLGLM